MSLDQNALDSLKLERNTAPRARSSAGRWLLALLLVGGGAAAASYWYTQTRPLTVETALASVATGSQAGGARSSSVLNASGYVVARREATVSSKVTGKVAEVFVEEGMAVKEGDLLARLDDETLRPLLTLAERQVEATRSELDEVRVRHEEAQRNLARVMRLRQSQASSEADADRAQSEVAALEARLTALRSSIEVAEATVRVRAQDIEDLMIRAPFAGVIVSKDAQPGEMVSPVSAGGGFTRTGIATIVDMDSREIEVDVNESFINRVHAGQRTEAVLDAYPDWRIASHVINIVPTADRQKATVKVRIGFDELDARILPNMGVKVTFFDTPQAPVSTAAGGGAASGAGASAGPGNGAGASPAAARASVRVPATALVRDGARAYVFRVRDGRVERVAVGTGTERDGQVEIVAGITAGEVVVLRPPAGLADGDAVATR